MSITPHVIRPRPETSRPRPRLRPETSRPMITLKVLDFSRVSRSVSTLSKVLLKQMCQKSHKLNIRKLFTSCLEEQQMQLGRK